jgi:hypothetical protein
MFERTDEDSLLSLAAADTVNGSFAVFNHGWDLSMAEKPGRRLARW